MPSARRALRRRSSVRAGGAGAGLLVAEEMGRAATKQAARGILVEPACADEKRARTQRGKLRWRARRAGSGGRLGQGPRERGRDMRCAAQGELGRGAGNLRHRARPPSPPRAASTARKRRYTPTVGPWWRTGPGPRSLSPVRLARNSRARARPHRTARNRVEGQARPSGPGRAPEPPPPNALVGTGAAPGRGSRTRGAAWQVRATSQRGNLKRTLSAR